MLSKIGEGSHKNVVTLARIAVWASQGSTVQRWNNDGDSFLVMVMCVAWMRGERRLPKPLRDWAGMGTAYSDSVACKLAVVWLIECDLAIKYDA
eukprot:scaffold7849_cov457-Prasinococcus_capsulatus_cf.AAC.3